MRLYEAQGSTAQEAPNMSKFLRVLAVVCRNLDMFDAS